MLTTRYKGEEEEAYRQRMEKNQAEIRRHLLIFVHATVQALLAAGLLELRPWKPRTVGLLGVIASVMNCYMLFPALPRSAPAKEPAKTA